MINTPFGLFRYNFLPFGLNVAPAIFQECINGILDGLNGIEVYQDDIFVHGVSRHDNNKRLLQLFGRFVEYYVAVNPSKCKFAVQRFDCLGFTVDKSGFYPDKKRLNYLVEMQSPSNCCQLRSIMGAIQYYSRFIPNFAGIAECLFELQNAPNFQWNSMHEQTLRKLLAFLNAEAILQPFAPRMHSTLITDASPSGIAAVLEQEGRPVVYISRRLSTALRSSWC